MVYLVKLDNAYKIGFSDNVAQRIKTFQTTHIEVELICVREGDRHKESGIHNACNLYHIKNELFKIDPNVIDIFKAYIYDDVIQDNIFLKKKIEKLEKEVKRQNQIIYSKTTIQESKIIKKEYKKTLCRGLTYPVIYTEDTIQIGDLLFYDIEKEKLYNDYGQEAKEYTTKKGEKLYYIGTNIALKIEEVQQLIKNLELTNESH